MPTFAIGCADRYDNADEGWGLKPVSPFSGNAALSWHIAESLIEQEFDICTCQEMLVDHGLVNPMRALFGDHDVWPVQVIPLAVNTVQHPVPSASRCLKLGQALKVALESYPDDLRIVVIGTGGMSHQLQGERAGLIDVEFDLESMFDGEVYPDFSLLWLVCHQSRFETTEWFCSSKARRCSGGGWIDRRSSLPVRKNRMRSRRKRRR